MGNFLSCYNLFHYNLFCILMKVNFKAACSANRSRYTEIFLVLYYCCRYVALSGFFSSTLFLACFPGLPITLCNCCGALWVGKGNRLHYFRIISRFLGVLFVWFFWGVGVGGGSFVNVFAYSFCLLTCRCSPMRYYRKIVVVRTPKHLKSSSH